ncbi:MAG: iron-containing alcohol dehydrogenase [Clostridia bacterium]|nr:iron-containing alcohol dehydrogenase [Clostridia bacterium]
MSDIMNLIKDFRYGCPCGMEHTTTIRDVRIGSGLVSSVGEILKENNFSKNLLLVADKNTLKASEGIEKGLEGFNVEYKIYDNIRVAEMFHVEELEKLISGRDISVLSVGSGSVNDHCRLACARQNKLLCIFATAPSMDGFASYSSPIVDNFFKASYDAKSPEVIIADTKILASAPAYLKSSGFGDMIAKYIGICDWEISNLLSGEYYCERISEYVRKTVDELLLMADTVTVNNEKTAGAIFEQLLKTGIFMSFTKNSRPASGSEHIIAHLMECLELPYGIIPNYHGEDVGVATLKMLKLYKEMAKLDSITAKRERVDWEDVYSVYGEMAEDVRKLNTPSTVTDAIDPRDLENKWDKIRKIIDKLPDYERVYDAMKRAGCKTTLEEIGKSQEFYNKCVKYSPYMRRRITFLRLKDMINEMESML